jgi:hypothetical protein
LRKKFFVFDPDPVGSAFNLGPGSGIQIRIPNLDPGPRCFTNQFGEPNFDILTHKTNSNYVMGLARRRGKMRIIELI